jgi:hypothetical protein
MGVVLVRWVSDPLGLGFQDEVRQPFEITLAERKEDCGRCSAGGFSVDVDRTERRG